MGIRSGFLKRMQLLPMSSFVVTCFGYSCTNQSINFLSAYKPMWYTATKFFCEAMLMNGNGSLGSQ